MELIRPQSIPEIDALAMRSMGVTEEALILRAGTDAAEQLMARVAPDVELLILCGGGNNGADGYALALAWREAGGYAVAVDALGRGQRSEGGRAVLAEYTQKYGAPLSYEQLKEARTSQVIVDAVLGSGAVGALSPQARRIAKWLRVQSAYKVALDIPLGVDADYGEESPDAVSVDLTVVFSFYKRGILSYPARGFCGEPVLADLGFGGEAYRPYFCATAIDAVTAKAYLPPRDKNSHKGSFGRLHVFAGSKKFRGAAHLVAHGALRMGVGLLTLTTEEEVVRFVGRRMPELLFDVTSPIASFDGETAEAYLASTAAANAVVIGPGCSVSEGLYRFLCRLLATEGAPVLLDADALGAIAAHAPDVDAFFASAKRSVVMTPHPLEFARLVGLTAKDVQAARMRLALEYAKKWGVSLLLKGAGTVITDGERLYINTTGSSALAKGGSGDVLAGAVGAFLAAGVEPLRALALGAYLHGAAGDALAKEYTEYGVLPSDLPAKMAQLIVTL